MKNYFIFILTTLLLLSSCGIIDKNNAIDYNNSLVEEQELVADKINEFIDLINESDSLNAEMVATKRKEVLNFIDVSIEKINNIGGYNGSEKFKESIIDVMNSYRNGVQNEYTTLAKFHTLPLEEQTTEGYFETLGIAYIADSLISIAEGDFMEAQEVFAAENELELSPVPADF